MSIEVTSQVFEALDRASRSAYPREACGLLLGEGERISTFIETRNVHATPETHFEIDPQSLIDAHRSSRHGGPEILGHFHSHPQGDAEPSSTDLELAAGDGKVWAIWGRGDLRFYRSGKAGFEALSLHIVDG
ncbi:Mov34/MPN/PAD-1 family protein [Erythrobacter sp. THAF29]|uniref:Mov34/MPN/PAD-1 family protein n=1 Tax=Erythrobacter sp. THAF29 TaxID=2587851 RepID=UPI001268B2FE|nr:M67 family metallopeptidase [Erythrobacter sp. THAF29]QFT76962.1 hypothetical protein FIU90_05360 [Erythrobacter sp. THAF29]